METGTNASLGGKPIVENHSLIIRQGDEFDTSLPEFPVDILIGFHPTVDTRTGDDHIDSPLREVADISTR